MKEMLRRAGRTFLQTSIGYILTNITVIATSSNWEDVEWLKSALGGLAISAIAAGLAAVMNIPTKSQGGDIDEI